MTRPPAAVVGLAAVVLAGCGGSHNNGGNEAKKIYAGEVGALPAPTRAAPGRAKLVLPRALTVPGRFPLNSIVAFNVPIRNDGTRPLRIERLDPG